ncbi:GNAT family N-acetyltransferase [Aquimarina rhabdastrellae]
MLFATERLDIRKLQSTDIDSFYDMQRNPKVMQYIKKHMNRLESEKELARFISYDKDETKFFNIWAVTRKDDHEFIGICGVYKNDKSEFEIAYRLRELYWKKGYGREIATSLIRYCFDELKLNELTAYVHKENKGSVRILEKEMQFIEEFYDDKTHFYERVYKLKRKND